MYVFQIFITFRLYRKNVCQDVFRSVPPKRDPGRSLNLLFAEQFLSGLYYANFAKILPLSCDAMTKMASTKKRTVPSESVGDSNEVNNLLIKSKINHKK